MREPQGSPPAPVYYPTESRSHNHQSPDLVSTLEEIRSIRDQEDLHDDPLDLFSNAVEYNTAIYSPMRTHSERDIPSPLHYLDLTESNHQNIFSTSGEDMLPDAAVDLLNDVFDFNAVVDSVMGMLFCLLWLHNYLHPTIENTQSEQENPLSYIDQTERDTQNFISKSGADTGTHHTEEDLQVSAFKMDVDSSTGR